jgi:DNA-directed RNA polymerase subunit H (RpoH/RPB5)
MNNTEIVERSFQTIIEMLNDRQTDIGNISKDAGREIVEGFLKSNKVLFEIIINKVKIVYSLSSKSKWVELKKLFEDSEPMDLYILVAKEKLSQNNSKMLTTLKVNLQIFDIKQLQFNISKHVLVPKHDIIRDEKEIKSIIERFSLKSKYQLPIILKTDAMAKYLGLKNGDIVRITRDSPTSGEYVIYRCCI